MNIFDIIHKLLKKKKMENGASDDGEKGEKVRSGQNTKEYTPTEKIKLEHYWLENEVYKVDLDEKLAELEKQRQEEQALHEEEVFVLLQSEEL